VYRSEVDTTTRSGFAALVIAGHCALIYAVAVSLGVVPAPPMIKEAQLVYVDMPQAVEDTPPAVQHHKIEPDVDVPVPPVAAPSVETAPVVEPTELPQSAPTGIPALPIEAASLSVTKRVEPVYPPASRRAGEAGQVNLRVLVDESGRPREVKILQSSGFVRLDEAAVSAVMRWLFSPARDASGPVTAWTQVNVRFQLQG
jgi:protein TonB